MTLKTKTKIDLQTVDKNT